jgi:tungstate transport system substrate-binding protein
MRPFLFFLGLAVTAIAGCSRPARAPTITLATTTSMQDSGMLDVLVPLFREQTGIEVKVVAVGTGQALELARRGDADVVLAHDPAGEQRFMDEGFGIERRPVMWNDFVLVGPAADPAGVKGLAITKALVRIAQAEAPFVSRGDESGTHVKEKLIWGRAKVQPKGGWYVRAGTGMGAVLRMASEKRAYTLTDRGTFLAQRSGLELVALCEGGALLKNPYSVIVVRPQGHSTGREQPAHQFADFLTSPEGRRAIADFGKDRFGQPLFFPSKGRE